VVFRSVKVDGGFERSDDMDAYMDAYVENPDIEGWMVDNSKLFEFIRRNNRGWLSIDSVVFQKMKETIQQ